MQPQDERPKFITDCILKDWLVFEIEQTREGYLVTAQYKLPVWACPRCEVINPRLRKYGTKEQFITLPAGWLKIKTVRQRYQCQHCGVTFWEPLNYQPLNYQMEVTMSDTPRSLTMDVTLLDVVVQSGEGKPVRPWIVVAMDGTTRQIVAAKSSCSQPDEEMYKAFLEETRMQNGRTPCQLVVDSGLAASLNKIAKELNMDLRTLRPHPAAKGRIERFFRMLNNQLFSQLPGHIRGENAEKPAGFPGLTLAEFEQRLNEFITQYNATNENKADTPGIETDPSLDKDDDADNEDDLGRAKMPETEPHPF